MEGSREQLYKDLESLYEPEPKAFVGSLSTNAVSWQNGMEVSPVEDCWRRELGILTPTRFCRRVGGRQSLVQRLKLYKQLDGHDGCVNTASFTPDGCHLLSGSDDRNIMLWDWSSGVRKLSYFSGHDNNVFQARAMPYSNNKVIVSCAADGQVRVGTIPEGGKHVETRRLAKHAGRAHKLAIEPYSPHIFYSCGEDGVIRSFDLRSAKKSSKLSTVKPFQKGKLMPTVGLNAIVVNPRRPHLFAVGGSDVFARVYDVRRLPVTDNADTTSCVDTFAPPHLLESREVHITCVAYSEQEELLISYNDELIYLFEKDQGLGPTPAKPAASREDVAASTDENDLKQPAQVYQGHRNSQTVKGVNFFGPTTEYVVSGSDCGHIYIWKKRGGQLVSMIFGDSSVVNCLEPHPYATFLATSGIESNVKIWAPTADNPLPLPANADKIMEANKRRRGRRGLSSAHEFSPDLVMRLVRLHRRRAELAMAQVGTYTNLSVDDEEEDEEDEDEDEEDEEEDESDEDDSSDGSEEDDEDAEQKRQRQRLHGPPECRVG